MDCETGEITNDDEESMKSSFFDAETGEMVHDEILLLPIASGHAQRSRTKFTIPKAYLKDSSKDMKEKDNNKCYLSTQETFTLQNKKKVIELKEVIISKISSYMQLHDLNTFVLNLSLA